MLPVPGIENVECAWVNIKSQGFTLHGFLTFLQSDHYFPEYLEGEGLGDLDIWSGHECAIFVVQSPSTAWIEYAETSDHPWWKIFGSHLYEDSHFVKLISDHSNAQVLAINGSILTFRDVFAPRLNQFQHNDEIAKILRRFGLKPTDHPSLILFKDFNDRSGWYIDLKDLVAIREQDLRASLQKWFSGPEFERLLKEASRASS